MANIKITDLTAYTDPDSTDVLPIVDVGADVTKKVSIADLLENAGSGTASAPGIAFDGDSNTGIYRPGADQLAISTNGTGRLFVDANGRVGVGVSSPVAKIHSFAGSSSVTPNVNADELFLENNGNVGLQLGCPNTGNARISFGDPEEAQSGLIFYDHSTDHLRFDTAATERLRITSTGTLMHLGAGNSTTPAVQFNGSAPVNSLVIDSSGRVGLGTSSPSEKLGIAGNLQFEVDDGVTIGARESISLNLNSNGTQSNRVFQVKDNGTARFTVQQAGNVGIGTTAPSFDLMIDKDSNSIVTSYTRSFNTGSSAGGRVSAASAVGKIAISAYSAANSVWPSSTVLGSDSGFTGGLNIYQEGANPIVLWTNGFERARIDSSGRLLVGTSTTSHTNSIFQAISSSNVVGSFVRYGAPEGAVVIASTTGSNASPLALANNTSAGAIYFQGYDGAAWRTAARIQVQADGQNWTSGDCPARLVFSTNPGSPATAPVERMRIQNDGDVLINTVTEGAGAGFSTKLAVSGSDTLLVKTAGIAASSAAPARFWHDAASGDNLFVNFATDATYTSRAFIDYNRSAGQVRYNVTSDRRLKSNIQDSESALNVLNQIKVRSYIWTETGYSIPHGFIAQELNEAVPDAVRAGDDGDEVVDIWAVDNAKLVPLLTKALQEALAEIESLKARVTALEP